MQTGREADRMSEFRSRLIAAIQRTCPNDTPLAIAFSGGLDSLTGALAASAAGRRFVLVLAGIHARHAIHRRKLKGRSRGRIS
jgi:PP-loop superfamily ATP-utilizing enzyme